MAEQTVREQLVKALEGYIKGVEVAEHLAGPANTYNWRAFACDYRDLLRDILDRARAEPEGCICDTCPVCAVSVRDCQCYQEGTEAQREPAGRGTA